MRLPPANRRPAKPLVVASLEEAGGLRCIDVMRAPDGGFGWRECRRDPEDGTGWRAVGAGRVGFGVADEARADRVRAVGWRAAGA